MGTIPFKGSFFDKYECLTIPVSNSHSDTMTIALGWIDDTRGQCYKTFFVRDLQILIRS